MTDQSTYPVDPMAAFYAAVTAVENGSVGEVELEFRHEFGNDDSIITSMAIRREARPNLMFAPIERKEED